MEKYWKGGVSAIISQGKLPSFTDVNRDDISEGLSQKNNIQSDNKVIQNALVKRGKSPISSNDGNENSKKDIRRNKRKKKKLSCGKDDGSSEDIQNVRSKRRKNISDELKVLESDNRNLLSDDVNQYHIRNSSESQRKEPACPESHSSYDVKNLREKSFDNKGKRPFTNKNETPDGNVDKSSYTIFVGNLPLSFDHKKVVKLFSKFGKVETARIRCVPVANANIKKKISAITKKFHPNRKSAVAYVVFKTKDSVGKAIAENGMVINGHHLRIDTCVSHKRDTRKSVFVGGLPFDIEDDELWDFFKNCGEIEGVRVVRDDQVSMGKGFGYVNFKSSASVELALKLNGEELKNRKINVERCTQKKKKTNPTNSFIFEKKKKGRGGKQQGALPGRKLTQSSSAEFDFQGRKAEKKPKKKKKALTKNDIRKNQIKSAFHLSSHKT